MAETFSLIANLLIVVVMATYLYKVVTGAATPNTATWLIWVVVMTVNTLTYFFVVRGNIKEIGVPAIANIGIIAIFVYSLFRGKFSKIGVLDTVILYLALVVGAVWKMTGNVVLANLALQFVLFISFIPTARGLWKGELRDHPLAWGIAVLSYCFQILTILYGSEGWTWPELAFPVINGIIGNGSVLCIIVWRRTR